MISRCQTPAKAQLVLETSQSLILLTFTLVPILHIFHSQVERVWKLLKSLEGEHTLQTPRQLSWHRQDRWRLDHEMGWWGAAFFGEVDVALVWGPGWSSGVERVVGGGRWSPQLSIDFSPLVVSIVASHFFSQLCCNRAVLHLHF